MPRDRFRLSTQSIIIRPCVPEDLDTTIEIFLRAVQNTASADYTSFQVNAGAQAGRRCWTERWLRSSAWLAVLDRFPAGFTELMPCGHIEMMFVHPSFGGRGVASALLEIVEEAALAQGVSRLSTEASITARPFFERRGFRVVAAQQVRCRGARLTNFRMEKLIKVPASGCEH